MIANYYNALILGVGLCMSASYNGLNVEPSGLSWFIAIGGGGAKKLLGGGGGNGGGAPRPM